VSHGTASSGRELAFTEGGRRLPGHIDLPTDPRGLVLFAHGSGSSRLSPRNRRVAGALHETAMATYLFDLLTDEEAVDRRFVFDIVLLARRLLAATDRVASESDLAVLPLGYFGASTGAAAALVAAAERPEVRAIVSRGGRPDLAGEALGRVRAPTLLIVGGDDPAVVELNERARAQLPGEAELVVIPGATHLFEEPGALERVADLAAAWFSRHLAAA
jgi:pimeloyl-ACP methyl ester carboxylesterase